MTKTTKKHNLEASKQANLKAVYAPIGASNHSEHERHKEDYYATDPVAIDYLLKFEDFENVLEPACGEGHLSKRLIELGVDVHSSDLINRGYGEVVDFFNIDSWEGDLITNPPYKIAQKFVEHSVEIIPEGRKVAMFLKLTFLEGQSRRKMFEKFPPKTVYVFSKRIKCARGGDFNSFSSSAVAYAWFVWKKGYTGKPKIEWID